MRIGQKGKDLCTTELTVTAYFIFYFIYIVNLGLKEAYCKMSFYCEEPENLHL